MSGIGTTKTRGEMEAAIAKGVTRYQVEFFGRGPDSIQVWIRDDLIFVRLRGVLTPVEKQLTASSKGQGLVKVLRKRAIEIASTLLHELVKEVTGITATEVYQDISPTNDERIIAFTLSEKPLFRDKCG